MNPSEDIVDEPTEEAMKAEITARQHKENLKIKEALRKQDPWRDLIED